MKPVPFILKHSIQRLLLAATVMSLTSTTSVSAHTEDHSQKAAHARHAAAPAAAGKFTSVGEAWAVLQGAVQEIQTLVSAKDLKSVHPAEEKVRAALQFLQGNSTVVTGDKVKRLDAALKQAVTFSGNVHRASDDGNQPKTEAELKKLVASLKLIEAQYPADALKTVAVPAGTVGGHEHHGAGAHDHGAAKKESTMQISVRSAKPLTIGQKADVTVRITTKDGAPVALDHLEEAHTEKIHLLVIDPSLTDYHHEHPKPTGKSGEYAFSFTPQTAGPYRIWADLVPTSSKEQEYVIGDLPAHGESTVLTNRTETLTTTLDGLTYTLSFKDPLEAGEAILGTLTVKEANGQIFPSLEPIMGAYAHIVGFSEDYKTIAHIHPMGEEPTKATDRGAGELKFHLMPEQPGLVRLFAQVQIGGESKFAPFTLQIEAGEPAGAVQAKR